MAIMVPSQMHQERQLPLHHSLEQYNVSYVINCAPPPIVAILGKNAGIALPRDSSNTFTLYIVVALIDARCLH
jgi:hypothetical protein